MNISIYLKEKFSPTINGVKSTLRKLTRTWSQKIESLGTSESATLSFCEWCGFNQNDDVFEAHIEHCPCCGLHVIERSET